MAELMLPNFLDAYNQGIAQRRQNELLLVQQRQAQTEAAQKAAIQNELASSADPYGSDVMNRLARLPGGLSVAEQLAKVQEARGKGMQEATKGLEGRMAYWKKQIPADSRFAPTWVRSAYNDPIVGPELSKLGSADEVIAGIPQDPNQYMKWVEGASMFADEVAKRRTMTATEAATAATAARNATTSEGQLAVAQQREGRLATEAKAAEDQSIMGHAALVNAASRYNLDGTLPPLGMGKAGAKTRGAILEMAALLNKDIDPTDQRLRQISNKANTSALVDLSKREAQVGAFERNFVRNADIVEKMSTKMDQSGSPIIQKWINAGKKKIGGDPEIAALDVAIKAVVNEYGKIVSGSMGNTAVAQSEIKRMEDLLNNANTTEQVIAILNTMRQETDNRMVGFKEEKDRLRGDISGKPTPAAPAAPTKPPGDKKPMRIGRFEVTPAG